MSAPETESDDNPYGLPKELVVRLLERVIERIERGEDPPRRELPADKATFPKALFLDTLHWIALARVHYGKSNNQQHRAALEAIRSAVTAARLVVPITVMNLGEVAKRGKEDSRQRLAEFIVELSGNFSTIPNSEVEDIEIDDALRKLYFEVAPTHQARRSLIRWGTRTVFSTNIVLPEHPDPRVTRAGHEVGLEPEISASMMFQLGRDRAMWNGIKEIDESGRGTLAGVRAVDTNLAAAEKLRRERRNLITPGGRDHFLNQLNSRLRANGIPVAGFHRWLESDDKLAALFEELPSWVVPSTLMFERDRNQDAPNHANDVVDLSFLRVAVPYGNVVATEKSWAHYAHSCRLEQRYQTTVISDLGGLPAVLARGGV